MALATAKTYDPRMRYFWEIAVALVLVAAIGLAGVMLGNRTPEPGTLGTIDARTGHR